MASINGTSGNDTFTPVVPAPSAPGEYNEGDTLFGQGGDDIYEIGAGDTTTRIVELTGQGTDTVISESDFELPDYVENLDLDGAATTGVGNGLANIIRGLDNATNYILDGGAGNDAIYGNDGDDNIDGEAGADSMNGGAGDDTYYVDNAGDVVTDSAGTADKVFFAGNLGVVNLSAYANIESFEIDSLSNNPTTRVTRVNGTAGDDNVAGNEQNNTIYGMGGNDELFGDDGNDLLDGGDGDDVLNGGTGKDRMIGGDGNDTYFVDDAGDVVIERTDEGTDLVNSSVDYILGAAVENLTLSGTAIKATGNSLTNTLTGNAQDNIIDGGKGIDTMIGAGGHDTYIVDNTADVVTEGAAAGTDLVRASASYTLGANIENLTMTANNLTGTGNTLANVLTSFASKAGTTTLVGGTGNDIYYLNSKNDVVTELAAEGTDTVFVNYATGVIARDDLAAKYGVNVEVFLSDTAEIVDNVGTRDDDGAVIGGAAGGSQTIDGGTSRDSTLQGGAGDDIYYVRNATQVVDDSAGDDTVVTTVSGLTLAAGVENLVLEGSARAGTGNGGVNEITGNDASNVIDGGADADVMTGGKGNDTYYVDNAGDTVVELAGEGTDKVIASVSYSMAAEVENLDLVGALADTALGNALNNTIRGTAAAVDYDINGGAGKDIIYGNDGDDLLDGGLDDDRMYGGKGDDTYYVDSLKDVVVDTEGTNDRIILAAAVGGLGTYRLAAGIETLTLDNANAGLKVIGNATANIIGGGTGNDTIDGGAGNDTVNAGTGLDTVHGGSGNDLINGDAGNDLIYGDAGNDTINGGADADTIYGDAGNDVVHGDAGNDSIYGGSGNDELYGDAGTDTIYGGSGNDTIYGGADADVLHGEAGNDQIEGGLGNDTIYGGAGNDSILGDDGADTIYGDAGNDIINGGLGDDLVYGGMGNDLLTGDAGNDVFVFEARGGRDTITDFTTGEDTLNIADVLIGFTGGSDIHDFARFLDNGDGDAQLQISARGTGTGWQTIAVLDGISAATLDVTIDVSTVVI